MEQVQVSFEGTGLNNQSSVKYWVFVIDKELTWKAHINHLQWYSMAKMALIRRAGHHLPCQVRELLYQISVLLNLDYCSVIWNSGGSVLSNKLGRQYKTALKWSFRSHCERHRDRQLSRQEGIKQCFARSTGAWRSSKLPAMQMLANYIGLPSVKFGYDWSGFYHLWYILYRVNIGSHTHTHKDNVCRTESCVMVFVVYAFMYVCVSLCMFIVIA